MPDFDPRSAGHDYDWDALTPEDGVEIMLERLADLHEALASDWKGISPLADMVKRPTRDENMPPHIQMIRWMPILADYQMFARRANKASLDATTAEEELVRVRSESIQKVYNANIRRDNAVAILTGLKKHLRGAIIILDDEKTDG